jgi:hypothetical protein
MTLRDIAKALGTYPWAHVAHVATGFAFALALHFLGAGDVTILAAAFALAIAKEYLYDRRIGKTPHLEDVNTRVAGAFAGVLAVRLFT